MNIVPYLGFVYFVTLEKYLSFVVLYWAATPHTVYLCKSKKKRFYNSTSNYLNIL